jgi:hypothetical protein
MDRSLIGTCWTDYKGNHFKIYDLSIDDSHTRVYYSNTKQSKEYNCFLEAFLARFTEYPLTQNYIKHQPKNGLIK